MPTRKAVTGMLLPSGMFFFYVTVVLNTNYISPQMGRRMARGRERSEAWATTANR